MKTFSVLASLVRTANPWLSKATRPCKSTLRYCAQYRKVLLQGHVALESHGLAARAKLASTENVFIGL